MTNLNANNRIRYFSFEILLGLILCIILNTISPNLVAGENWVRKACMPTPRWGLSTCVVNGRIYAIGGIENSNMTSLAVEEYDPVTDKWCIKGQMPSARRGASSCELDGRIYVIGGYTPGSNFPSLEQYNPVDDTWLKLADMPTPRLFLSVCAVNGKIYAIGGWNDISLPNVEEYNPKTNTWMKKSRMPTPRDSFSIGVVDGKIYAIGGKRDDEELSVVEEYDPKLDRWTVKSEMPTRRQGLSTSVIDGKIYALGGAIGDGYGIVSLPIVEQYDPSTDIWTKMSDIPTARSCFSTSAVDGKIYIFGGKRRVEVVPPKDPSLWDSGKFKFPESVLSTVFEYTPTGNNLSMMSVTPWDKRSSTWGEIKTIR
ncbi:hypothetical protein FJZ33_05025 [Candidatus Poribacteria bacterium]|nr:hypothetical protein [Candidatus Poribacteria bacterium]